MKMQVLYSSKNGKGNAEALATLISRSFKCKCDQIPPAYPCEKEKLVVIVFDHYGRLDKKLIDFAKDLTTDRAANVALVSMSSTGSVGIGELDSIFKANKVNIAGACELTVKKGLFSAGKLTDADTAKAIEFSTGIVKSLFDHFE